MYYILPFNDISFIGITAVEIGGMRTIFMQDQVVLQQTHHIKEK